MAYETEYSNFPSENITLHGFKNIDDASVTYTLDGQEVTTTIDKLIAQINQAINQVSQVVQNNSATSEECAAASEELSDQAIHMRDMISIYNLGESSGQGQIAVSENRTEKIHMQSNPNEQIISLGEGSGKY